jgi:hypothetical protein
MLSLFKFKVEEEFNLKDLREGDISQIGLTIKWFITIMQPIAFPASILILRSYTKMENQIHGENG